MPLPSSRDMVPPITAKEVVKRSLETIEEFGKTQVKVQVHHIPGYDD
jgi:hypothetical protein